MNCPLCNTKTEVYDSRPQNDGSMIWRRRECPACKYRMTTCEVQTDDFDKQVDFAMKKKAKNVLSRVKHMRDHLDKIEKELQ